MPRNKVYAKGVAICLAVLMVIGAVVPAAALAKGSDLEGHWAKEVVSQWLADGLVNGYPDGSFRPNQTVTRAEFMTMVNNAFGFASSADVSFTDLAEGTWYYPAVQTASRAGYVSGYPDGSIRPGATITRQEAAVVLANVISLAPDSSKASGFGDVKEIPQWSKGAIGIVAGSGVMKGYPDGTFGHSGNITRAEAVTALNSARNHTLVFTEPGKYVAKDSDRTITSNVVVRADGVTLENYNVKGDLIIAEEVGKGTVTLNNLTVEGDTIVRGGGTDSVRINGGTYRSIIVENAPGGGVRILAQNMDSEIEIVVSEQMEGQKLLLEGTFEKVVVRGASLEIETLGTTKIGELSVDRTGRDLKVTSSAGTVIAKATVNSSSVTIGGTGKIEAIDGSGSENIEFSGTVTRPQPAPTTGGSGGGGGTPPSDNEEDPGEEDPEPGMPAPAEVSFVPGPEVLDSTYLSLLEELGEIHLSVFDDVYLDGKDFEELFSEEGVSRNVVYANTVVPVDEIPSHITKESIDGVFVVGEHSFSTLFIDQLNSVEIGEQWTVFIIELESIDGLLETWNVIGFSGVEFSEENTRTYTYDPGDSGDPDVAVEGVSITGGDLSLAVGEQRTMSAVVTPENATNKSVWWESGNEAILSVDGSVATGVTAGTVTLAVYTEDGEYSDSVTVEVYEEVVADPVWPVELDIRVSNGSTHDSLVILLDTVRLSNGDYTSSEELPTVYDLSYTDSTVLLWDGSGNLLEDAVEIPLSHEAISVNWEGHTLAVNLGHADLSGFDPTQFSGIELVRLAFTGAYIDENADEQRWEMSEAVQGLDRIALAIAENVLTSSVASNAFANMVSGVHNVIDMAETMLSSVVGGTSVNLVSSSEAGRISLSGDAMLEGTSELVLSIQAANGGVAMIPIFANVWAGGAADFRLTLEDAIEGTVAVQIEMIDSFGNATVVGEDTIFSVTVLPDEGALDPVGNLTLESGGGILTTMFTPPAAQSGTWTVTIAWANGDEGLSGVSQSIDVIVP